MTRDLVTVTESTALDQVVHLMETHGIKRLPVLRRGKVVGIVSRANLMRALASLHRVIPKTSKDDVAIRNRILSAINEESWSAGALSSMSRFMMAWSTFGAPLPMRPNGRRSKCSLKACPA
jgi:CBS domain-containing protein